jgi:hypothetical protein
MHDEFLLGRCGFGQYEVAAEVPREMPLASVRSETLSESAGGNASARSSPRPGATVQKARAVMRRRKCA